MIWPNPGGSTVKNLPQCRRHRFDPWVRKVPGRRAWQPTPVVLPRKPHRQRSLAGDHGVTRVRHNWSYWAHAQAPSADTIFQHHKARSLKRSYSIWWPFKNENWNAFSQQLFIWSYSFWKLLFKNASMTYSELSSGQAILLLKWKRERYEQN